MRSFLFNSKIKIFKILIPYLVKYKAFNFLSVLFILSLSELKPISPKKKKKFKIVILSKSAGIDDVIESKKNNNDNILYLACPRVFIKTIFNTIFNNQEYNDTKKFFSKKLKSKRNDYKNFLIEFLNVLKNKYSINAFVGFNFEFMEEVELAAACQKLKIPFLLLYKESVLTGIEEKYLRHFIKKLGEKFNGYKIAVYSDYAKKIFIDTNFVNKKNVEVVGCSRLSKSFSFRKKIPKKQILYYAIEPKRGLPDPFVAHYGNNFFKDLKDHRQYDPSYNWNFQNTKIIKILRKFAIKNPDAVVIIKIKTGQLPNAKQYLNLPNNIRLQYFGVGHQLLEKSKVVIAWNTTAILEGIAANRFILLPYFHKKDNNFRKQNELKLKLRNENYGYSEYDFYKKLLSFIKKKYNKNKIYNNQYSLKYHLNNADNKASLRLNKFFSKNVTIKKF